MEWQLLRDLSDGERRQVLARTRRRQFARGEVLFHEGDPADTVHFIAEGRVMVRRSSPSGDSVAFLVVGPGRALGEVALLSKDRHRSTTVVALEPTTTLSLAFPEFERLCEENPGIQRLLATLLAARVKRLSDHLVEALFLPSDRRILRRVVDLCEQYDSGGIARRVSIPLSQTDIAELAGASRPTTNRVLRRLEEDGLVQLHRGRLDVTDRQGLQARDRGR
jgi:CRP/FNR family transcriptional regulator, cyclic AMP receptor protein